MANGKDPVYEQITEFEARLNSIKSKAQRTREARMKSELKLDQLKGNETELIKKIKGAGLDPENLKGVIISKQKDLNVVLNKLEGILPDENGKLPNNVFVADLFKSVDGISIPDVSIAIPSDVSFQKDEAEDKVELEDFDEAVAAEDNSKKEEVANFDIDEDMPF